MSSNSISQWRSGQWAQVIEDDRLIGFAAAFDCGESDLALEEEELTAADFAKAIEIRGIPAMENRAPSRFDDESSESSMGIVQDTGAPMVAGREGDPQRPELERFPIVEFVDAVEAEIVDEIADLEGHPPGTCSILCHYG